MEISSEQGLKEWVRMSLMMNKRKEHFTELKEDVWTKRQWEEMKILGLLLYVIWQCILFNGWCIWDLNWLWGLSIYICFFFVPVLSAMFSNQDLACMVLHTNQAFLNLLNRREVYMKEKTSKAARNSVYVKSALMNYVDNMEISSKKLYFSLLDDLIRSL